MARSMMASTTQPGLVQLATSTPEYLALRKSYRMLLTHIKTQPGDFCDVLFEKGYVSPAVCDFVRNRSMLDEEKAQKLVDTVLDRVEFEPSSYHGFVSILKSNGPWAKPVCDRLMETFKAEQAAVAKLNEGFYHSLSGRRSPDEDSVIKSPYAFHKDMTCSDLSTWLAVSGLPKDVISVMKGQDIDGDSFLQLARLSKGEMCEALKCNMTAEAYSKLQTLFDKAQESEKARIAEMEASDAEMGENFVCPFCGKCSMTQFFSRSGCPNKPPRTIREQPKSHFPFLNPPGLNRNEKLVLECQLMDDVKKMVYLFAGAEDSVIVSLQSRIKNVSRLRNYAIRLVKQVGTEDEIEKLEKAECIAQVFLYLHRFKSFFNYEITESIVKQFGNDRDCQQFDDFASKVRKFSQRGVFEVPPNVFHDTDPKPGDRVVCVNFIPEEQATLENAKAVRRKIANILKVNLFSLQFYCVSDGNVRLKFVIRARLAEKIFPLSRQLMSALNEINVTITTHCPSSSEETDDLTKVTAEEQSLVGHLAETVLEEVHEVAGKENVSQNVSFSNLPLCALPSESLPEDHQAAANDASLFESKIWKGKELLKVFFLNPEVLEKRKCAGKKLTCDLILTWASVWEQAPSAPIFMKTTHQTKADIRVKVSDEGDCWSLVGTQASSCDQSKPTMVFNLSDESLPKDALKHLVAHEFGHALGLEHTHVCSDFWDVVEKFMDKDKMKSDLVGDCVSEKGLAAYGLNRRAKKEAGDVNVAEYDTYSIMRYRFSTQWLKNKDYLAPEKLKSDPGLTEQERKYLLSIHDSSYAIQPTQNDIKYLEEVYWEKTPST